MAWGAAWAPKVVELPASGSSSSKVWLHRFYSTVSGGREPQALLRAATARGCSPDASCTSRMRGGHLRSHVSSVSFGISRLRLVTLALPEELVVGRERDHGRHGGQCAGVCFCRIAKARSRALAGSQRLAMLAMRGWTDEQTSSCGHGT